jgi:hypothetical protein
MKDKDDKANLPGSREGIEEESNLQGYPLYPANEDFYGKYKKEKNINPEDISKNKESNENDKTGRGNEKDSNGDVFVSDLDIPGSELDNDQESVGSEDEENNFYSLGGDNHNDLDEDNGAL